MRAETIDLSDLIPNLPVLMARSEVPKLLGGVISAKRLANLDSEGRGPKRMRMGRKVVYRTVDFLEWLAGRTQALL